ncbi:MAG: sialate O-acetylesterase, partial [Pirellulaceae bacterium]|nr:sialate O-acetylesterase [Pirellulaceae bacterium]
MIKTAWGGKSLQRDFRPPSAGGEVGPFYTRMLAEVHEALADARERFPALEGRAPRLTGLVWFQGWNDGCGKGNPKYTEQLACLIRDLRKELKTPKLPVVIGELGIDGAKPMGWIETFRKQQAAVAAVPEFKGNVLLAKTAQCWPPWYKALDDKWRAFKAKEKAWRAKRTA